MDTTILRIGLGIIAVIAAIYLVWPQVAVWLDRVKHPVCGACRYAVAGIAALRCPECGGDLREVGILTPGMMMRRAPGPRTWVAAWTLIWSLIGLAAAITASTIIPGKLLATRSSPVHSISDPTAIIEIVQTAQGWYDPAASRVMALNLKHTAPSTADGELKFTWPSAEFIEATGSASGISSAGRTVDADTLTSWLRTAAIPQPEVAAPELLAAVRGVAAQPVNSATDVATGPSWNFAGSMVGVRRFTPWWVQVSAAAAWLLIWALIAIPLARRVASRDRSRSLLKPRP